MTDRFIFSGGECAAYIAAIVRSFQEQHKNHYLGRTALQKLSYFCKALGVPIPCRFEIYTYGPYSDTITFTVESLLADEVLSDKSRDQKYSNYRLGSEAGEFFDETEDTIKKFVPTIDMVVQVFGTFQPNELELIATLHYISQRQWAIDKIQPSRDKVFDEFIRIKGDKFSNEEISAWYDALTKAKLL